jgi:hypothetical protein
MNANANFTKQNFRYFRLRETFEFFAKKEKSANISFNLVNFRAIAKKKITVQLWIPEELC